MVTQLDTYIFFNDLVQSPMYNHVEPYMLDKIKCVHYFQYNQMVMVLLSYQYIHQSLVISTISRIDTEKVLL